LNYGSLENPRNRPCPLCHQTLRGCAESSGGELFACLYCGNFSVATSAKPRLFGSSSPETQIPQKDRIRLAWLVRAENDEGNEVDFTAENLDRLLDVAPSRLTPPRAAEAMLLWVVERADQLAAGHGVEVDPATFTRHRADSPESLGNLIHLMVESGWVRQSGLGLHLTPAGWNRGEELAKIREDASGSRGAWRASLPGDRAELVTLSRKAVFERDLVRAIAEASADEPLALIATDIDHFKSVNDRFLHAAGDEVLKAVGALHELVCRGRGKGYRVGGEELMILAPNTSPDEAIALAERLRRSVEARVVEAIHGSVTISAGVAIVTDPQTKTDRLKAEADEALYRAKHGGRNRVEIHGATAKRAIATASDTSVSQPGVPKDRTEGRPPDIPPDAFATIRKKCEADWPDDFQMRHHCETKQIEAYRKLYRPSSSLPPLSAEATGLLEAAAQSGELLVRETDQTGKWLRAGARDFCDQSDPAVAARHLDALDWLVAKGLARHDTGALFVLTGKGFEVARALHH
jgi:diguanylate cyclase (GGDEF)-like protein